MALTETPVSRFVLSLVGHFSKSRPSPVRSHLPLQFVTASTSTRKVELARPLWMLEISETRETFIPCPR
jgi:hypothetical protein